MALQQLYGWPASEAGRLVCWMMLPLAGIEVKRQMRHKYVTIRAGLSHADAAPSKAFRSPGDGSRSRRSSRQSAWLTVRDIRYRDKTKRSKV